ncbi:MAG: hypothetical protein AAE977_07255 [Thermoplasmataceae archaeon]
MSNHKKLVKKRTSYCLAAYLPLLAANAFLSVKLVVFRVHSFGFSVSYIRGIPVAVAGIYFFTFMILFGSIIFSRIKGFSIPGTLTLAFVSALSFFELTYSISYALYS